MPCLIKIHVHYNVRTCMYMCILTSFVVLHKILKSNKKHLPKKNLCKNGKEWSAKNDANEFKSFQSNVPLLKNQGLIQGK